MTTLNSLISDTIKETIISEIFKRPKSNILELGINAYGKKKNIAKRCWQLIQNTYKHVNGGCQSFDDNGEGDGGFNDFLQNYIWRVWCDDNGEPRAIVCYKSVSGFGRKRVAPGLDGTAEGKKGYNELLKYENHPCNHCYGEVSGSSEKSRLKNKDTHWLTPDQAKKVLPNKNISTERDEVADKQEERIPYDANRHYYRNIGNIGKHRKAMFGYPIMPKKKV